jgi:hypothetical protein
MTNSGHRQIEWDDAKAVERVLSNGKRRYTAAFKTWLVEQCRLPGVSVASIAFAKQLNANLVRRRIDQRNCAPQVPAQLLPARIEPSVPMPACEGGMIEPGTEGTLKVLVVWGWPEFRFGQRPPEI